MSHLVLVRILLPLPLLRARRIFLRPLLSPLLKRESIFAIPQIEPSRRVRLDCYVFFTPYLAVY
jgi:hypothetical protein